MKASSLEQEIASLRKEVELLRQQKPKAKSKASQKTASHHASTAELEQAFKKTLATILSQVKKDYDNLSPVTTLVLFALGAMLGGALAKGRRGR